MPTGTYAPFVRYQLGDNNLAPLALGTLETYAAGTSTPLATHADVTLLVANPTTITLNSAGVPTVSGSEVGLFLTPGLSYKFIAKNEAGTTIWTRDHIQAIPATTVDVDVAGTAGQLLSANDIAYLSDGSGGLTAGRWYQADADLLYASLLAPIIGVVVTDVNSGEASTFRISGRMTGFAGLTAGLPYYVSATAGGVTSTAPTYGRFVGMSESTTALVLAPNPRRALEVSDLLFLQVFS